MKRYILISITLFFLGCGADGNAPKSSTTPPQPNSTVDIAPPASPTLE